MKIAIIGQQDFGKAVFEAFLARGDEIAGVFCAPEKPGARPDALKVAAQEKGIPVRHTVDLRGRFLPEVEKFAGVFVKEADPLVVDDLRERGLLYKAEEIRHSYPFCWRCDTTLIYYALDSWYIRTTDFKDELVAQNQATSWTPAYVKNGRMGDWLANNVDWAISRTRYWGTPLPFWVCESCGVQRCVASAEELGLDPEADLHRPFIDSVELDCECTKSDCERSVRVPLYVYGRLVEAGDQYLLQTGHHAFSRYRTIVAFGLLSIEERIT